MLEKAEEFVQKIRTEQIKEENEEEK